VAENPVEVHDLQATILHLMGLDPLKFSFRQMGLDHRLIGPAVGPRVISEIVA
jgi:hypothetical protein